MRIHVQWYLQDEVHPSLLLRPLPLVQLKFNQVLDGGWHYLFLLGRPFLAYGEVRQSFALGGPTWYHHSHRRNKESRAQTEPVTRSGHLEEEAQEARSGRAGATQQGKKLTEEEQKHHVLLRLFRCPLLALLPLDGRFLLSVVACLVHVG